MTITLDPSALEFLLLVALGLLAVVGVLLWIGRAERERD